MSLKNKTFPILLLFLLGLNSTVMAQSGGADENLDMLVDSTKSDLLIVVGGGLAGAILGLSTLSFVEEPKDHTDNIIMGASLGIIAGVGYVAFSQANKTQEMIYGMPGGESVKADHKNFKTYARYSWHRESLSSNSSLIYSPYQIGHSFRF
jgi:hypothetical protein